MRTRMGRMQYRSHAREFAPSSTTLAWTRVRSPRIRNPLRRGRVIAGVAWACLGLLLPHSTPALAAGISVTDAPEMTEEEAQSLAFLRIQPAKTGSYVGELVPVQIKAYFREALQARLHGSPRLDGAAFTWHLPEGEPQRTREVVDSQVYTVLTWYAGMSAIKPGDHPVAAQLEATLLVPEPTRARGHTRSGGSPLDSLFGEDFLADFFGKVHERRVTLASETRSLRAEPLPADGQPADFKGAVGRFELSARATPVNVALGDPVTLRTTLQGHGNFDRVAPPRLSDETRFRTYAPTSKFEPRDTVGYEGAKRFDQVIIPKDPAVAEIPAVTFTYFDPDAAQYRTARTAPIPLHVAPGEGSAASAVSQPDTSTQERVGQADSASSGVPEFGSGFHHELGRLSRDMKPVLFQPWFMGLQALPLLAIGWGLHGHRRNVRRRDDPSRIRRTGVFGGWNMKARTMKPWGKATLLGMIGLFALAGPVRAGSAESLFADGNRAWFAGDYARSIQSYEAIAQQEGISPGLLHNLARAYQANGDLGRARLTIERARWLAPRDAGIRAGLHDLQKQMGLPDAIDARWARPFLLLSLNEWIWFGATAWAVFGGLILARGLGVKRLPYKTALTVSGTLLAMGISGIGVRWTQMDQAVVLGDQAFIRVSPYAAAREVAVVSQGNMLTVIGSHGAFLKVRTADGQTGWMAATHLSRLTGLDFTIPAHGAEVVSAANRARDAGSEG